MPFLKSGCKGTNKLTIIKWQLTIIQNFNIFYTHIPKAKLYNLQSSFCKDAYFFDFGG